jgi:hypothetical protein
MIKIPTKHQNIMIHIIFIVFHIFRTNFQTLLNNKLKLK